MAGFCVTFGDVFVVVMGLALDLAKENLPAFTNGFPVVVRRVDAVCLCILLSCLTNLPAVVEGRLVVVVVLLEVIIEVVDLCDAIDLGDVGVLLVVVSGVVLVVVSSFVVVFLMPTVSPCDLTSFFGEPLGNELKYISKMLNGLAEEDETSTRLGVVGFDVTGALEVFIVEAIKVLSEALAVVVLG